MPGRSGPFTVISTVCVGAGCEPVTAATIPSRPMGPIEVTTAGPANGGGAVGRLPDGRAVFVEGALPGERVVIELTEERRRFARGRVLSVLEPSEGRIEPPCPLVAAGCGGCDLQHATAELARSMKERIVGDALERVGRVPVPELHTVALVPEGFRTTARAAVDRRGRAGFRRHRSHDVVVGDSCLVVHPLVEELLVDGRYHGASEVVIRVGARTGERMVLVSGRELGPIEVPDDVRIATEDAHRDVHVHEVVADRRWRISAGSFFQTRADGADALVETVRGELARATTGIARLADLCAGVGLFAGSIAATEVVAIEANRSACDDARHNLADRGATATVIASRLEDWRPSAFDAVVADPARDGLAAAGVAAVAATGAGVVVLVSCDAGSFGRDAGLLAGAGYRLDSATIVDMFPHTHHIEVVGTFVNS